MIEKIKELNITEWIVIALNMCGAVMVALGLPLYANAIWVFTNPYWILHNYFSNQDKGQAFQYFMYWGFAIFGVNNLT